MPSAGAWCQAREDARALSARGEPLRVLARALSAADAGVIILAFYAAYVLRHGWVAIPLEALLGTGFVAAVTVNVLRALRAYGRRLTSGFWVQMGLALQAWSIAFASVIMLGYLTKTSGDVSRVWALAGYVLALAGLAATRLGSALWLRHLRRTGRLARTVAIVDLDNTGAALARRLNRDGAGAIRLVGLFSDDAGVEQRSVGRLLDLSHLYRIDDVLVTIGGRDGAGVKTVLHRLRTIPTNVRLCPDLPDTAILPGQASETVFGVPTLTVQRRPMGGCSSIVKRMEDLVLSAVLIVLTAPLLLLIAAAIKLDSPGPVLFRQKRHGFNNNPITILKFRSMVERREEQIVMQARRDDARVTRVGQFIRRTSLDELPQLFNVLRGEMSLVGPRPHALSHNEQYAALIGDYLGRHRVQPGITGLAQVHGYRGETETLDKMQKRVAYDLAYIDNWSVLLDLKILVMTAVTVPFHSNAY